MLSWAKLLLDSGELGVELLVDAAEACLDAASSGRDGCIGNDLRIA
jgi:hypothetical protein